MGAGNDVLTGGAGNDRFDFTSALNATTTVDTVADFNVANDTIGLENTIFTALPSAGVLSTDAFYIGSAAHDASDRIIYDMMTGSLFYDSNGSAAGGSIKFAELAPGLALTNADFQII
jgi:serralysin